MESSSIVTSLNQILEMATLSSINTQKDVYNKYKKYILSEKSYTIDEICKPGSKTFTEYQLFLRDFIRDDNKRGILLYHGLGSGKTISSILIAEATSKFPKVNVFLPASLKGNFTKELTEYAKMAGTKLKLNYDLHSYNSSNVISTFPNIENSIVIIDEVHKITNMINSGASKVGLAFYKRFKDAKNVKFIFLTGTPIVNEVREFAMLINIIKPGTFNIDTFIDTYFDLSGFKIKNKAQFYSKIEGLVSYYKGPSEDSEVYPKYRFQNETLVMSPKQAEFYKMVFENELIRGMDKKKLTEENVILEKVNKKVISTYAVYTRQACNIIYTEMPHIDILVKNLPEYSIKFHNILNKIVKSKGKVLVYSNFVQNTLKVFADILKYVNISHILWTGQVDSSSRNKLIRSFNHDNNLNGERIKVILISSAGAEGISLKAVRHVHIMEPHWNDARIIQVIGRSVRLCSHIDLEPSERNVTIYRYYAYIKNLDTSDIIVHKIASKKMKMINLFEDFIKKSALDCLLFKRRNKTSCIEG